MDHKTFIVLLCHLTGCVIHCSCFNPPSPENGELAVHIFDHQLLAISSCHEGYLMHGANVSVCQSNNEWLPPMPQCLPVNDFSNRSSSRRCDIKDALLPGNFRLPIGVIHPFYNPGQSIDLLCDKDFVLQHSLSLICLDIGQWAVFGSGVCARNEEPTLLDDKRTTNIDELTASHGSIITVPCPANNDKELVDRVWLKNSIKVSEPGSHISEHGVLIISGVNDASAGTYICIVYYVDSVDVTAAIKLSVRKTNGLSPPSDRCRIQDLPVQYTALNFDVGQRAYLNCGEGHRYHAIRVTWFKDEAIVAKGSGNGTLVIPSVDLSHSGVYICVVNFANSCSFSREFRLKVHKPDVKPVRKLNFRSHLDFWQPDLLSVCGQPDLGANLGGRRLKIVDGVKSTRGSWPWMAVVGWRGRRGGLICGGSLISDKWVLTAAHCFRQFTSQVQIQSQVVVKLGKLFRYQVEPDEMVLPVRRVIIHENYSNASSSTPNLPYVNDNDIALVELRHPVSYTGQILPVCLPPPGFVVENMRPGSLGTVTGWGFQQERGPPSRALQEVHVPLVSEMECNKSSSFAVTSNMFCAGYEQSYLGDTCKGDSGGPFVVQFQQRWYVAGVVSWGEGCSRPAKYGIYTRVDKYFDWIVRRISKSSEK